MKKFLLSAAAVALFATSLSAQTKVKSVKAPTNNSTSALQVPKATTAKQNANKELAHPFGAVPQQAMPNRAAQSTPNAATPQPAQQNVASPANELN